MRCREWRPRYEGDLSRQTIQKQDRLVRRGQIPNPHPHPHPVMVWHSICPMPCNALCMPYAPQCTLYALHATCVPHHPDSTILGASHNNGFPCFPHTLPSFPSALSSFQAGAST